MADPHSRHTPVLVDEILEWMAPRPGQLLVDGTLGGGGHARRLAERVQPGGRVLALDLDPAAIARFAQSDQRAGLPLEPIRASYEDLPEVLSAVGAGQADGILLDLGLSTDQLADTSRGFSYYSSGPLDLRFDPTQGEPAWQLLARLDADRLAKLIFQFSQERYSRRIARRIVAGRKERAEVTAAQVAELVRSCVPRARRHRIDPATRTFQALRIAVNDELGVLERALGRLPECLRPGGRLAVVSFHSLEDRLVKTAFRADARYMTLTKKPIRPKEGEVADNPHSRSARLRVAEVVQ